VTAATRTGEITRIRKRIRTGTGTWEGKMRGSRKKKVRKDRLPVKMREEQEQGERRQEERQEWKARLEWMRIWILRKPCKE